MTRKRILLIYFGFLLALLAATALVLQESGLSQTFIERALARILNPDRFSLGNARIDLGEGSVILENLHLTTADGNKNASSLDVDKVTVIVNTNPLGQVGSIHEVVLMGVQIDLDLSGENLPNFADLLTFSAAEIPDTGERTPAIVLRDARISLRFSPDSAPIHFTQVNLRFLPEQGNSGNMILAGTMVAPGGYAVKASGSGNLAATEFRTLLEIEGLPLNADIARLYSPEAADYLKRAKVQGAIDRFSMWLEYPSRQDKAADDKLIVGANLLVSGLSCSLPELPYPLVGAQVRIALNSRNQGTASFAVKNESIHGDLQVQGTFKKCLTSEREIEIRVEASDLLISPALEAALSPIAAAKKIFAATLPTSGRFDADLHIWNAHPGGKLETALDIELKGISATYRGFHSQSGVRIGFPSQVNDIQGRVRVRPGLVTLERLTGLLSGAAIQVDGSIGILGPGVTLQNLQGIDLDIRGQGLPFSPEIRESLHKAYAPAAEIYDQYSPTGSCDVQVRIESGEDPRAIPGVRVILGLQSAGASYQGFRLPISQLRGKVDISAQGIVFDIEGTRGAAELSLHGQFQAHLLDQNLDHKLWSKLWLTCKNLDFDSDLAAALGSISDAGRNIWREIDPHGNLDCELSLWRRATDPDYSYDLRIDLHDVTVQPELAHHPITGLSGPIFVHGTGSDHRIDVSAIQGLIYNGPDSEAARLVLQGAIVGDASNQKITLNAVVRDLQLTDRFAAFLDRSDALSLATWKVLEPSGHIDIITEIEWTPQTDDLHAKLRIQLKNVASSATFLPGEASQLNGALLIDGGNVTFQDIRGLIGESRVHCTNGSIRRVQDASVVDVMVAAEQFPIDDRLANLMSGPLRTTYLDRNMDGRANVRQLQLKLTIPDEGPMLTEVNGKIIIRKLDMDLGTRLQGLSGSWMIERAVIGEQAGSVEGTLENSAVTVLGHELRGLSGKFIANTEQVVFQDFQGRVHNGRLVGNATDGDDLIYRLTGSGDLRMHLRWEQINLAALLRTLGFPLEEYRGNLSGVVALEQMPGNSILDAKAVGTIKISEGHLGTVPLFSAIYSYLSPRRRPSFDEASLSFALDSQEIAVKDMNIRSPVLTVTGGGTVRLDGYLNLTLDFPNFFGTSADWLVFPQLIRFLGGRVVQFQIHGYLRNPVAKPRWLWQTQPAEIPIAPIPAFRSPHLQPE